MQILSCVNRPDRNHGSAIRKPAASYAAIGTSLV
jgi:hypothetical protein